MKIVEFNCSACLCLMCLGVCAMNLIKNINLSCNLVFCAVKNSMSLIKRSLKLKILKIFWYSRNGKKTELEAMN